MSATLNLEISSSEPIKLYLVEGSRAMILMIYVVREQADECQKL